MKISLPLKLGIFVVLLFAAVIAACLLWTPVRIRYYTAKLKSDKLSEQVAAIDGLLSTGKAGIKALGKIPDFNSEEIQILTKYWNMPDVPIEGNICKDFPIHLAARKGLRRIIRLMLEKGADPNSRNGGGYGALCIAACEGYADMARILIDGGANVNIDSRDERRHDIWAPIDWAAMMGHKEIVEMLLENGAKATTRNYGGGGNVLHCASINGHADITGILIEHGADVNEKNQHGRTPIFNTANYEVGYNVAVLLVEKGARIKIKDNSGNSPLIKAAHCGRNRLVKLLLENGADINACGFQGRTALHNAVWGLNFSTAKLLLEKGADVNALDDEGRTPLDSIADWVVGSRSFRDDTDAYEKAKKDSTYIDFEKILRPYGAKTGEELKAEKK
ncbi:MAG: ankyrin repeat domain-containing protein [Planctomycetota bacterium]|jgi:ankyrin repeat protein